MIDYLEGLLEEETAVELTGRPLLPAGRRNVPHGQEDAGAFRSEESMMEDVPAGGGKLQEGARLPEAGRRSWVEEGGGPRSGAVRLLDGLRRAELAAGAIRQQGRPLAVTLSGEPLQTGKTDLHAIDRAVQRDARRYDGGFPLY